MKRRRKRDEADQPRGPHGPEEAPLVLSSPNAADTPSIDQPFDEDLLDKLENQARSPDEIRRTDLVAIGLLVLACAIFIGAVALAIVMRHRHAAGTLPTR